MKLRRIWQNKNEKVEVPVTADIGAFVTMDDRIQLYVTDEDGQGVDIVLPASLAKLVHALLGVALVRYEQGLQE